MEKNKEKLILSVDTTSLNTSCALTRGLDVIAVKNRCEFLPKTWNDHLDFLPYQHQKFLIGDILRLLKRKKIDLSQIDMVSVSSKSGVKNCLLVGKTVAHAISTICAKPLFETDHILAHLYSCFMSRKYEDMKFPILVFSASGSHNEFALMENSNRCKILFDDAPPLWEDNGDVVSLGIGNIFSRIKNQLGMADRRPGFRITMGALMKMMSEGNPHKFDFKKFYQGEIMDLNFLNFLKSIFSFYDENVKNTKNQTLIKDYAASVQESLTEILAEKILYLAKEHKAKEIHVTGGISCNNYFEEKLKKKIKQSGSGIVLRYPLKMVYRLDNAAMIGALTHLQKRYKIKFIDYKPNIT